MKLLGLSFDDDANPDLITVAMTRDEAILIAQVLGHMKGTVQEAVFVGGDEVGSDIYGCLVGDVFNRYWEDGVTDALRERRA